MGNVLFCKTNGLSPDKHTFENGVVFKEQFQAAHIHNAGLNIVSGENKINEIHRILYWPSSNQFAADLMTIATNCMEDPHEEKNLIRDLRILLKGKVRSFLNKIEELKRSGITTVARAHLEIGWAKDIANAMRESILRLISHTGQNVLVLTPLPFELWVTNPFNFAFNVSLLDTAVFPVEGGRMGDAFVIHAPEIDTSETSGPIQIE